MIVADLVSHKEEFTSRVVVTGNDPVPVDINLDVVIRREDMRVTHEEADTILINQVVFTGFASVLIVADDTDVFVLLCHFIHSGHITGQVKMVSPVRDRAVIDMNSTVQANIELMPDLLAAHGITGCDTVATYFGIGKAIALKVLRSRKYPLNMIGDVASDLPDAIHQATQFVLACYGQPECGSMTDARHKVWSSKVKRSIAGAPKLQSLPPTDEAFRENVARAHLQVAIWRNAHGHDPPPLDPLQYGWIKEECTNSVVPRGVPEDVALAPNDILKLIKCSCDSVVPCKSKRCSCQIANMACTMFCICQGGKSCYNEKSRELLEAQCNDDGGDDVDNSDNFE